MNVNVPLKYKEHNFNVTYYEFQGMSDFDYVTSSLALKSLKDHKNISIEFELFADSEDSSLVDLFIARYNKLYKPKEKEISTLIEEINVAISNAANLVHKNSTQMIPYLEKLNLYLLENKLYSYEEIENIFKNKYSTKNSEFGKIEVKKTENERKVSTNVDISEELNSVKLLGQVATDDQEIVKNTIQALKNQTKKLLPSGIDVNNLNITTDLNGKEYITEPLNETSSLTLIKTDYSQKDDYVYLYDKDKKELTISEILSYKEIPVHETSKINISDFWSNEDKVKYIINEIKRTNNSLNTNLLNEIIISADSEYALTIISNNINPTVNNENYAKLIDKSIEFNIPLYKSKEYVKNNLNNYVSNEVYYKYIVKFFDNHMDLLGSENWIKLLSYLKNNSQNILVKEHFDYIEAYTITKKDLVRQIENEIAVYGTWREDSKKELEINKINSTENQDEKLINRYNELRESLISWRNVFHTVVHLKSYSKADMKKAKDSIKKLQGTSLDEQMLDLKKRFSSIRVDEPETLNKINEKDIELFTNLKQLVKKDYDKEMEEFIKITKTINK